MNTLNELKRDVRKYATRKRAISSSRFFKTGPGEYGEGDKFIGINVPNCRKVAKKFQALHLSEVIKLIRSEIHEERLIALLILIEQFRKGDPKTNKKIFNIYLKSTKYVNNWDLVDLSAHKIVGEYLYENPHRATHLKNRTFKIDMLLNHLAKSDNLWERRIAIISTAAFIRKGEFNKTLEISEILINDKHDLIHKAVGWMLREVGKKSQYTEEQFLKKRYKNMPRTMLRYAIERFEKEKRKLYLIGEI